MPHDSVLLLAVDRGWISDDQARSGRTPEELLTPAQIAELTAGRRAVERMMTTSFLSAADLVEAAPRKFGRYEILRMVGEGAAGQVWLAFDPVMNRDVAIKVLSGRKALEERFRREMEILGSLKHPNIVTIYDAGLEEGKPYYAMEYLSGSSLDRAEIPWTRAVGLIEQVARACHAAHERGVVHRDLKPANILLADDGRPVVADFGLARTVDSELTETGQSLGTPVTMSPEQASGWAVDARTDVYSLGVVLYHVLTGRYPFTGDSVAEIVHKIVQAAPEAPRALNPSLPEALETIALKAMEKEPGRRYATAEALADDLRAWAEGRPIRAKPPTFLSKILMAARRRPSVAAAVALAVLLAGGGVAGGLALRRAGLDRDEEARRARRAGELQQAISSAAARVRAWEKELYKPPREVPYAELDAAVRALEPLLASPDAGPEARYEGWLVSARARNWAGRRDEALALLARAIDQWPGGRIGDALLDRARIRWDVALRHFHTGRQDEARKLGPLIQEDVRAAIQAGFDDPWMREFALALRPVAESRKAPDVRESLGLFGKLRAMGEHRAEEIDKVLGDLHLFLGQDDQAGQCYSAVLRSRESYLPAYVGLALAHLAKGRGTRNLHEAFRATMTAIDVNPAYPESYLLLDLLCRKAMRGSSGKDEGRIGQALKMAGRGAEKLRKERQVRPDFRPLQVAYGSVCLVQAYIARDEGKADPAEPLRQAVDAFESAKALDPLAPEAWLGLGIAASLRSSTDQALAFLDRGLELSPEDPEIHRWRGYSLKAAGRGAEAVAAWQKAIALDPTLKGELDDEIRDARKGP